MFKAYLMVCFLNFTLQLIPAIVTDGFLQFIFINQYFNVH